MRYDHPVAFDTQFEPRWLPDLLFDTAARQPDAVALDFMGRQTSYGELARLVRRAATGFRAMGAGPGQTVGLFLPNCPQYVIAFYGALVAGARVVNFSPLYSADELRTQVEDSETDLMVTLDVKALFPTIEQVFLTSRLKRLIVGSLSDVLPPAKALLYRLLKGGDRSPVPHNPGHSSFARLLEGDEMELPEPRPDPQEIALLQYTGGTTGRPKGAMLSHANLSINAAQVEALDSSRPDKPLRVLGVLPLFHIFANTCVLNRTILHGGSIFLLPRFDAKQVLETIQGAKITGFPGVPTMYRALLDFPRFDRYDLSSLDMCVSGGAPMPQPLAQAFQERTGAHIVEGYGMTESSGVVTANPFATGGKAGTIGQPLPATEIRLLDRDDPTQEAAPGEPGELAFRGPQMMRGYWKQDNGDVFIDGFMRSGDMATVDEDGYYRIVDRLKDMVIVGGFKVFPSQLEEILYQHRAVAEAVVIGVPDAYSGERPKAFVTTRPEWPVTSEELLQWLNSRVGKHERAVAVEIRESLPKTIIGKLSRKELVAEERAKAA